MFNSLFKSLKPDVIYNPSREFFYENYRKINKPCVIKGLTRDWPAWKKKWKSVDSFKKYYGTKFFECGKDINGEPVIMCLSEYLCSESFRKPYNLNSSYKLPQSTSPNPPYLFDPTFDEDNEEILKDFWQPSIFSETNLIRLIPVNFRPNYMWLLLGPKYSGSKLHIDPLNTYAYNTLLHGYKFWLIFESIHSLEETSSGRSSADYNYNDLEKIDNVQFLFEKGLPRFFEDPKHAHTSYVFIQKPGETVYIPKAFPHAVLNLTSTIAITENITSTENVSEFLSNLSEMKLQEIMEEQDYLELQEQVTKFY